MFICEGVVVVGRRYRIKKRVLIFTPENGLSVRNISSILKTHVILFCETNEWYPSYFKHVSPGAIVKLTLSYRLLHILYYILI